MAGTVPESTKPGSPVRYIPGDEEQRPPQPGVALCLSGGGYRAMLFHLGALWRLNELACLPQLARVSSVSGGSIVAGVSALHWGQLAFNQGVAKAFEAQVVEPIRALASHTTDLLAIAEGVFLPGTVADRVAAAYDKHLFDGATLQDLPDAPRFILNATSVQTGALWRFQKPYMADYHVGMFTKPKVRLAVAVASSSAFPPLLSPARIKLDRSLDEAFEAPGDLARPAYQEEAILTDGGVYDNLGLEVAWKRCLTVLVSDGGGKMAAEEAPHADWPRHAKRVLEVMDSQVRSLRKRQVIDSYGAQEPTGTRSGAYWGIRSAIANYQVPALPCPEFATLKLADTPTRLAALDDTLQERLINWGYAICDAAMRAHMGMPSAVRFPYPSGVGDEAP